ncbi:DUF4870 domain-containing protein [Sphingobacterium bovistauri]|uniref:Chloroplast import component protein (Tic20) n=1 Tax=Sphingobacterium bovistauri TaxID=2781959 RepID=A0ABS7Z4T4_9SPHI|nr:DUF4870 domain-containing protein [Sphingobacterium bovistauri]MCA5005213.1 hypothetical protein [Sphingobacterium bovistauri]
MEKKQINLGEVSQGKTVAIVSYLTIIGLIVALVMNNKQPTSLGRFHIRQSIGVTVLGIAIGFLTYIPGIGGIISTVGGIILLIALILGIVSAVKSEEKGLPVVGSFFQSWFSMI